MYSFNPLFKNSFFGSDTGFPGRGHGLGQYHAPGQVKSPNSTSAPSSVAQIERTLALAYEKLQVTATRGSAAAESGTAAPAETDFSPQAVTDRILGFVRDRLETERANGASEAKIKDLYQQAVSGVERGLREAKDIIQAQGLFQGEVKDNFYDTVTRLADGLEALGESLFGQALDTPVAAVEGLSVQRSELAFQRDRSFEMEVVTQNGDTIKLLVSSGQSGYANQSTLQADGVNAQSLQAGFASYDNLSFSVQGELDEGEITALKDLFSQVNAVAETFYGGDVQQAFDQAMSVGMDSEELAAFSVDMQQSQTVAVRETYVAIDNLSRPQPGNGFEDVLPRLGQFARSVEAAGKVADGLDAGRLAAPDLLRELVSRLYSESDTGQGNDTDFKRFIEALA